MGLLMRIWRRFDLVVAGKWLFLGALVGVVSGLGAIALQFGLQAIREICLTSWAGLYVASPAGEPAELGLELGAFKPWLIVVLPALGGLLSGLLVFWLCPEAEGHGTDAAIDSYHRKLGRIRSRVPLVKMIASAITIGTGGSGGREGPIAQIGAGFGSFLATRLGLGAKTRRMLLAAGMAGGVGAIFRAPLAGAIFAAEVLYSSAEVEAEVLLPSMVSSIVGYAVYTLRFGAGTMFNVDASYGFDSPVELGPYLVLALVVAVAALLYVKSFYGIRDLFGKLPVPKPLKPMIGGALTGAIGLGFILAHGSTEDAGDVLSSGYGILQNVIDTDGAGVPILLLLAVGFGKILTTSTSIGSGGAGGVFGPSMVIGGAIGAAVGSAFHALAPSLAPHPTTFAIVGMAGFFTAAANTPISTIIMVSELTGNYKLLVPSMWVCALAFLVGRNWTIYKSQLPSKALTLPQVGVGASEQLSRWTVGELFHKGRKMVQFGSGDSYHEVLNKAEATRQRVYPVTDSQGIYLGSFRVDGLLHALHGPKRKRGTAGDLIDDRAFFVTPQDSAQRALKMLRNNGLEEVVVVDLPRRGKVVGILTRADILLAHQRQKAVDENAAE